MLYGVFPFFILGFLLTVYPRWLDRPPVSRRVYVPIFLAFTTGVLLVYVGLFTRAAVLALALTLMLGAWVAALSVLLKIFFQSDFGKKVHPAIINLALIAGGLGILSFLLGVVTGRPLPLNLARDIGLWLFLVPTALTVGHRMIPFFSMSVLDNYRMIRPRWGLPLMMVGVSGHAILEILDLTRLLLLFDLPLAFTALYHTVKWELRRSFQAPLLAMLHVAFLWFGIAMILYTFQDFAALFTGAPLLGRAPLHALAVGFITGMVVAMVSRVTLGHSGQPLVADRLTWTVFLGINLVTVMRIIAEFPALVPDGNLLNLLAALGWLLFLIPWALRYIPVYLRPRTDGGPG